MYHTTNMTVWISKGLATLINLAMLMKVVTVILMQLLMYPLYRMVTPLLSVVCYKLARTHRVQHCMIIGWNLLTLLCQLRQCNVNMRACDMTRQRDTPRQLMASASASLPSRSGWLRGIVEVSPPPSTAT
jgi:hypothetical protein